MLNFVDTGRKFTTNKTQEPDFGMVITGKNLVEVMENTIDVE